MTRSVVFTGDVFRLQARGGISRYFVELIRRLRRPARVVAGWHRSAMLDAAAPGVLAARRAPVFPGAARGFGALNAGIDARALAAFPDAILHPTYYRDPASLPAGAPVVVTVFDMAHERHPERFRRRWWSAPDPARHKRALCARADAIVCISEATRRDLVEVLSIPPERTRVVHLAPADWSAVASRAIAGVDKPFLLWVGERAGYKNFDATLRAWAGSPAVRETALLCVGGGPLRAEERAAAQALGAAARVRQIDATDGELRWAYENARALVYTSLWEGFGLPVLEAMSRGCPVVASDLEVHREIAGDGAILVDPTNLEALRTGIERCLAAPHDASAVAARVAHAAQFTWDACAAAHEVLYAELDR